MTSALVSEGNMIVSNVIQKRRNPSPAERRTSFHDQEIGSHAPKALNAETDPVNEDLQSAKEELQIAHEELQSLNAGFLLLGKQMTALKVIAQPPHQHAGMALTRRRNFLIAPDSRM